MGASGISENPWQRSQDVYKTFTERKMSLPWSAFGVFECLRGLHIMQKIISALTSTVAVKKSFKEISEHIVVVVTSVSQLPH